MFKPPPCSGFVSAEAGLAVGSTYRFLPLKLSLLRLGQAGAEVLASAEVRGHKHLNKIKIKHQNIFFIDLLKLTY